MDVQWLATHASYMEFNEVLQQPFVQVGILQLLDQFEGIAKVQVCVEIVNVFSYYYLSVLNLYGCHAGEHLAVKQNRVQDVLEETPLLLRLQMLVLSLAQDFFGFLLGRVLVLEPSLMQMVLSCGGNLHGMRLFFLENSDQIPFNIRWDVA